MNSKAKIGMTALVSVLVLAIIGLTIGLVLVATQASIKNSMHVTYTVDGLVSCKLTATALSYSQAEDWTDEDGESEVGTTVYISDGSEGDGRFTLDKKEITISETTANASAVGSIEFKDVKLTADGRVEYKFNIINTSTDATSAIDIDVTVENAVDSDDEAVIAAANNIKVELGEEGSVSEQKTLEIADLTNATTEGKTIVVVLSVIDPSVEADLYANVVINISGGAVSA